MRNIAPYLIGLGTAGLVVLMIELGDRCFRHRPLHRRQRTALFAVLSMLCALWCIALLGVWWVFSGMVAIASCLAWASLGTALEWPGFRPEPDPEGEEDDETAEPDC